MSQDSYPLQWPVGVPRTKHPRRGQWRTGRGHVLMTDSMDRLESELGRLGARQIVLSSNLRIRADGRPYADQRQPQDCGIAVYFDLKKDRICMPCDRWDRAEDNIAAIAAHIAALRAIERYGVGTIEQAFRGYRAIPAPGHAVRPWRTVLFGESRVDAGGEALLEIAEQRFRDLAKQHHPDRPGGSHEIMAELTRAIAEARAELTPNRSAQTAQ